MPFFKSHEVPKQFFDLFLSKCTLKYINGDSSQQYPMLPVELFTGEVQDFMVRYFNRSGENPTEDAPEYYPCIVIQDFHPDIDRSQLWGQDFIEGFIDVVSGTRELVALPIPMIYRFQVSVVTRRNKDIKGSTDWFLQNFDFQRPGSFLFNKINTEEGPVGDVVRYNSNWADVPREDGRFESAYDFTLYPYLNARNKTGYIADPVTGAIIGGDFRDMVEKIKMTLRLKDFTTFEKILQHNFEISV